MRPLLAVRYGTQPQLADESFTHYEILPFAAAAALM